ncbi:MAG: ABC-F family ATP-binding cassette domain-containing protein [bacterium]
MFIAKNLELHFNNQTIFDNVSFNVNSDQRIGLVGRNGSGKTTLLKVIAGQQKLDSGKIEIQKDKKIAYLPQNVVLLSDKSVLNEALNTFDNLGNKIKEFNKLESVLDQSDVKTLEQYSLLQIDLQEHDYNKKITETKKILLGLGFLEEQLENKVDTLSVGWKMRLVLAKLLLQNADFYLFDEPTNHLDIIAKDWFLDFLKNADFGFMLVCHDRYFLDQLCEEIYEVRLGGLGIFTGNYSAYLEQKRHYEELLEKKYVEQQKFLKKEKELIDRFRASATKAKMVQSRLRALEKIEIIKLEPKLQTMRVSLSNVERSGSIVLDVKDVSKSFGDNNIFNNVSFQVERGEKVAIVAPNGKGKSTLLNIVMGKLKNEAGSFEFGHNVLPAFFEQDQNKSLNPRNNLLQEAESACKTSEQRQRVRGFLGAFLFSGDDVEKRVGVLSGGEKNRLAMVKVLLQNANFLLLDEPTNHLDIESKEVLLNVLKKYEGTILFVSHDRDFLNNLATDIIDLQKNSAHKYEGNYDSFLIQKDFQESIFVQNKLENQKIEKEKTVKNNTQDYETRKKIRNLESKIERLEKSLAVMTKEFESLVYGTEKYQETFDEIKKIEKELRETLILWESLSN